MCSCFVGVAASWHKQSVSSYLETSVCSASAQVPEECPESIAELIDECLERPPEDRPSAKEAFEVIKNSMSPELCRAVRPALSPS